MYTVGSPDPDSNGEGVNYLTLMSAILWLRVELVGVEPPPILYILGEGVNYLTLTVKFYANECNKGRDANP